MKNKRTKRNYSQVSRRIFIRYCLSLLIFAVVLLGGYFIAWRICASFTWYPDNRLYWVLKSLQSLSSVIIFLSLIIGICILTNRTIKTPLRYLDEVIDAAKTLSDPKDAPIELSDAMIDIQNELNLARQQALNNRSLLREAEQRKNDLIMYLAHDLKTPLASVIGYLNLLLDEEEISETLQKKYLAISLDKAERLEDLINEFFEIARFNLSHITLQHSRINLTRLLEQLVFEFQPMFLEKNLTCALSAPPDLTLICDVDKLQRVFDNLLKNAVFYSFENSPITITLTQNAMDTTITFVNQGNTIPREKLDRIFEQFYRLDTARGSKNGGAGLGLAIAKQIVELHGGRITAESEKEQIMFTVTLPVV